VDLASVGPVRLSATALARGGPSRALERIGRTLALVVKQGADGAEIVKRVVAPNSTIHADEARHWDQLHAKYDVMRINHTIAYSLDGACTNQAKSFLSRVRRMVDGHMSVPATCISMPAMRHGSRSHRRLDNGALAHRALGLALRHPISGQWKGTGSGRNHYECNFQVHLPKIMLLESYAS